MKRAFGLGVDVGGTAVKIGLVDWHGRVRAMRVVPTRALRRPAGFVEGVAREATGLLERARLRPSAVRGMAVGMPGPVDAGRGVVRSMVNLPGWRDVPLGRLLGRRLRLRCLVDNDVNLASLGEWRWGAGRGARNLVCVALGTGVGGGLVLGGRLYRGATGAAGEIGHMVIDPGGPRCGCGRHGCLEAHVGAAGIVRLARRAGMRGRLTPESLSVAAARGDARARRVWREVGRLLGLGVANLVNLLNPDRVVIGGGVAGAWRWFAPALRSTVRRQPLPAAARAVRVVPARLGNRAGVVGAAVLLWSEGMPAR